MYGICQRHPSVSHSSDGNNQSIGSRSFKQHETAVVPKARLLFSPTKDARNQTNTHIVLPKLHPHKKKKKKCAKHRQASPRAIEEIVYMHIKYICTYVPTYIQGKKRKKNKHAGGAGSAEGHTPTYIVVTLFTLQ